VRLTKTFLLRNLGLRGDWRRQKKRTAALSRKRRNQARGHEKNRRDGVEGDLVIKGGGEAGRDSRKLSGRGGSALRKVSVNWKKGRDLCRGGGKQLWVDPRRKSRDHS